MTIQHRPFTDDDLPNLQDALATWIHQAGDLGYCHIGDIPHRIYNGIRGRVPREELVHVWEENQTIIGMVIAEPFYNIFDVFTRPDFRGTLTELEMLQQAYSITRQYMNKLEREEKTVGADVQKGDATRKAALLSLGFEFDEYWGNITERSLSDPIPEPQLAEGFVVRSATLDDYAELAAVHSGAFGSNWTPELYRDEVMLKPGYLPEREFVVVAHNGRFAAFTETWLDDLNKVGYFEPVGVHSDYQRRGLGRAMLLYCLHHMKAIGMKTAMVDHAVDNPASTGLYHSLGFRTKHEIMTYKKA